MSAEPEARVDDDEPKTPSGDVEPMSFEPQPAPAVEPAAEPPAETVTPGPAPELKPEPKPEPKPGPVATFAAAAPAPAKPEPEPWKPRKRPDQVKARHESREAGDFDAVFEARSESGLGERLTPTFTYLLMIAAPLTLGLSAVPAAFIAYMSRETAPEWLRTHYLFQLRTFWAGLAVSIVAGGTYLFFDRGPAWAVAGAHVIWGLIWLLTVVWFVIRSATGFLRLRRGEAYRNFRTWTV